MSNSDPKVAPKWAIAGLSSVLGYSILFGVQVIPGLVIHALQGEGGVLGEAIGSIWRKAVNRDLELEVWLLTGLLFLLLDGAILLFYYMGRRSNS